MELLPSVLLVLGMVAVGSVCSDAYEHEKKTNLEERMEKLERLFLQQDRRLQLMEAEKHRLQQHVSRLATRNRALEERVALLAKENGELKDRPDVLTAERRHGLQDTAVLLKDNVFATNSGRSAVLEAPSIVRGNRESGESKQPYHKGVVPRSDDPTEPLASVVAQLDQRVGELGADVQAMHAAVREAGSSLYVRWGKSSCPSSSSLIYSGAVGGGSRSHSGAAANYLCLTLSPVSSDLAPEHYTYLYGAEYTTYDDKMNDDPVCAVCRSRSPTTMMVPGTTACPSGWTAEYSGFLMAGFYNDAAATEFICVDASLEDRTGSSSDENGKLLYFTKTVCGSLPCSPYVHNKVVTCAVCSM